MDFMQENCLLNVLYTCDDIKRHKQIQVGAFRFALGELLGAQAVGRIPGADFVVPVPQSGLYYAMGLAKALHIPYLQAIVKENPLMRTFKEQPHRRETLVDGQLMIMPSLLEGKDVIVVDEAIFTGVALRVICGKLKDSGVRKIFLCIPTPPCRRPCGQLPKGELLAAQMPLDEMAAYFGADGVIFQSEENFRMMMAQYETLSIRCFLAQTQE